MKLSAKDLLGLRFLTPQDISYLLDQAKLYKAYLLNKEQSIPSLSKTSVVNLFFEPSTRTKLSFEIAAKHLGVSSASINREQSSFRKGETLFDSVKNLQAMGLDGVIIRHQQGGAPQFIADHLEIPVINAGDGFNEHPTQGLLDIFTMIEAKGDVKGKKVLIWGDIAHSRVARSNIWGLKKLGAQVYVGGPATLIPEGISEMGAEVVTDLEEAIADMDFVNMLRVQYERQSVCYFPSVREFRQYFCLTTEKLKKAKKGLVVLHPGPINRGIELESEVADGPFNVILNQVTNGIAVRMAVLYTLLAKGKS